MHGNVIPVSIAPGNSLSVSGRAMYYWVDFYGVAKMAGREEKRFWC
jgi:hypothetical protein